MLAQTRESGGGETTWVCSRRQSQPGSSQKSSRKPYWPLGTEVRSPRIVAVRISRAASSGNRVRNGTMAMAGFTESAVKDDIGEVFRVGRAKHLSSRRP